MEKLLNTTFWDSMKAVYPHAMKRFEEWYKANQTMNADWIANFKSDINLSDLPDFIQVSLFTEFMRSLFDSAPSRDKKQDINISLMMLDMIKDDPIDKHRSFSRSTYGTGRF